MLGQTGKYRLDQRLGGGGMAEVFLGSMLGAEGFQRRVAIKRVLPGFSENPAFSQMFIGEAQISSQLQHANIVSVLDFDRDPEGRLFLVMELVEGKDLDALASSGPLPLPVIIYVIAEVLRGLGHAHDLPVGAGMRGIVHRDVSPHNVLLSWDGAVKVSDFGIAKAKQASEATASVFIKGKPAYMSPEQANGQSLDGRSDLFAVGVMLWEMLCGRRLFVGEDTRATLAAVLFGQIPRPRSMRSDIPKDLERVVMKLLERDLPARYATAEDAIHDLFECSDAPKAGRELLMRTMAERFPGQAPVRQSVARRGGTPPQGQAPQQGGPALGYASTQTPQGYIQANHDQQTIAGYVGQATPMPSIGAARSTPTGTIQPSAVIPRRGGGKKVAIIVVGAVVAVFVVVGIVASTQSGKEPVVAAGSGDGSAAGSVAVPADVAVATVQPDAAAPDAAVEVAAAPVDAGQKDATSTQTGQAGKEKRTGRLVVHAFPVQTVWVDDRKVHDTPVDMKLSVGKHKVKLVNSETGKTEQLSVSIDESKPTTIDRN
ncbi:MAG TPA: serine/threonine-protein kinase [Kofleriaceae bacterium]|nr:serine/threonine-protein kinase [Kofleriaceae bacterium]